MMTEDLVLVLAAVVRLLFTRQHLLNFVQRFSLSFRHNEEDEDSSENRESREEPESLTVAQQRFQICECFCDDES